MPDIFSNFFFVFLSNINKEIAKIAVSFLTFWDTYWYNDSFAYRIIFDMAWVLNIILIFLCNPNGVNLGSWIASSTIYLMLFVFLRDLGLKLTCISSGVIVRLSFISIPILLIGLVFIFLSWQRIVFWKPEVYLSGLRKWLLASLYFYINGFCYHFFLPI